MQQATTMSTVLSTMSLSQLYELLIEYTHKYTKMINEGSKGEDFKKYEEIIIGLQSEISKRRNSQE